MKKLLLIILICAGAAMLAGCGKDKPTNSIAHYNLSGTVWPKYTAYGTLYAEGLDMEFIDSENNTHQVTTGNFGHYEVTGLAEGIVIVRMLSSDTIAADSINGQQLLRYWPGDTTIVVSQDTVINLIVRNLGAIFVDPGTATSEWFWTYGVRNDGEKYIFYFDYRSNEMEMVHRIPVPADAQYLGYAIEGEAAPANTSLIRRYALRNGSPYGDPVQRIFTTARGYWIDIYPVGEFAGNDVMLDLAYQPIDADSIYIRSIYIFVY